MSAVISAKGNEQALIYAGTAAAPTEQTCTTTDTVAQAGVIDLGTARWLTIWGQVDNAAAGNIVSIKVWLCARGTKPGSTLGSDRWYPASKLDDLSTNAVMEQAPVVGSPVATLAPAWSQNTIRPMDIRTASGSAATDEIAFRAIFNVGDSKWALVTYVQIDAGTASKVLAFYSTSSG